MSCNIQDKTIKHFKDRGLIEGAMKVPTEKLEAFDKENERLTKIARTSKQVDMGPLFSVEIKTIERGPKSSTQFINRAIPNTEAFEAIQKYNDENPNILESKVEYAMRAVEILNSDKAQQVFDKGLKNNWDLNKILTELQIPKYQKQLIVSKGLTNREEIITSLLADNSFVVEINTAKEKLQDYEMVDETGEGDFQPQEFIPDTELVEEEDEDGNIIGVKEVLSEKGKKQIEEREKRRKPTQYYSNLTVPGGTNYTENEIATPDITPSIKGHAQFSTSNGIGWFRSDDAQQIQSNDVQSIIDDLQKSGQLEINCK